MSFILEGQSSERVEVELLGESLRNYRLFMEKARRNSRDSHTQMKDLLALLTGPHQPNHLLVVDLTTQVVEILAQMEESFRLFQSVGNNLQNLHGFMDRNSHIRAAEEKRLSADYQAMSDYLLAIKRENEE